MPEETEKTEKQHQEEYDLLRKKYISDETIKLIETDARLAIIHISDRESGKIISLALGHPYMLTKTACELAKSLKYKLLASDELSL